jgi:hypothetical protein
MRGLTPLGMPSANRSDRVANMRLALGHMAFVLVWALGNCATRLFAADGDFGERLVWMISSAILGVGIGLFGAPRTLTEARFEETALGIRGRMIESLRWVGIAALIGVSFFDLPPVPASALSGLFSGLYGVAVVAVWAQLRRLRQSPVPPRKSATPGSRQRETR